MGRAKPAAVKTSSSILDAKHLPSLHPHGCGLSWVLCMHFHPGLNQSSLICIFQQLPNWPPSFHPCPLHSLIQPYSQRDPFQNKSDCHFSAQNLQGLRILLRRKAQVLMMDSDLPRLLWSLGPHLPLLSPVTHFSPVPSLSWLFLEHPKHSLRALLLPQLGLVFPGFHLQQVFAHR